MWVNKKQKLQNRYRILNFQQNIKQVYNWLENHGEVFLRRNQSIGKNLMRAKMLHLSHENFFLRAQTCELTAGTINILDL